MTGSMIKSLAGSLLKRWWRPTRREIVKQDFAKLGRDAMEGGDRRAAAEALLNYLELEPLDANALNNLGICYMEIGKKAEGNRAFELAYSLDDSNMSVLVNHSRQQVDNHHVEAALLQLARARVTIPNYPYTNAVYAASCLAVGEAEKARAFSLHAWLCQFDALRLANSFLFQSAYCDITEQELATEHFFWAQTCLSPEEGLFLPTPESATSTPKMRIGYLSPDFRSHSVRYFFRPLLAGHDRSNVEIFLYHDAAQRDAQTDLIEASDAQFHAVNELSDSELVELIRSHRLDVLIELAGHTSDNRLNFFKNRLADLQVTGLGYPPTTGLTTIDYKLLDPYLLTENAERYYAEAPMVLPNSFWCFDPCEDDVPDPSEPPLLKNGYVTFAVVGNISKINAKAMALWGEILRRVPKSRLLIRAVNFQDELAQRNMENHAKSVGLPLDRLIFALPEGGADFYSSYNEIDIVLDTYPFNGGTTTCFAVYMGVPVVSMLGESLIGRMGGSILNNVGAPDLVVTTPAAYVARAVALSQDVNYLKTFRRTSRARMKAGSLGDGRKFARDLEQALEEALALRRSGIGPKHGYVLPLPADEAVRRAQIVFTHGEVEAAERIVAYALAHHRGSLPAHSLRADLLAFGGRPRAGADHLISVQSAFTAAERCVSKLKIAQLFLRAGEDSNARSCLANLDEEELPGSVERDQYFLLQTRLNDSPNIQPVNYIGMAAQIQVVIACDEIELFDFMEISLQQGCALPSGCTLKFQRINEGSKLINYPRALNGDADVLLFLQKNIVVSNSRFFHEVLDGLQHCDMLSFAGARRWVRLDWADDDYEQKASGLLIQIGTTSEDVEIRLVGGGREKLVSGMNVLHGGALAFRRTALETLPFEENYDCAGTLLEEGWSYSAARKGLRLAVHRGLGVRVRPEVALEAKYLPSAKESLAHTMGFDPFLLLPDNNKSISAAGSTDVIQETLERYFERSAAKNVDSPPSLID